MNLGSKEMEKEKKKEEFSEIIQVHSASAVISPLRYLAFLTAPSLLSHFQLKLMRVITFPHRKDQLSATELYL